MRQSDSIAKLAGALVQAHAAVANALKDSTNPHFNSRFASLNAVLEAVKPVYAAHGLAIVQMPGLQDGHATVETLVLHESGEWISGLAGAPLPKADPQGVGSAITYLRRYALAAMAGIGQEDDDGNAASERPTTQKAPELVCAKCGSGMWDNRTGKTNPKAPDLKCKSRDCGHALWMGQWESALSAALNDAHTAGLIDAEARHKAEEAIVGLDPSKMQRVERWLATLAEPTA